MKGIFFKYPLEFQLHVDGETWKQGDFIQGRLIVKNRGAAPVSLNSIQVQLALGELKKVRAKSEHAFKAIETAPLKTSENLIPEKEYSLEWKFKTDRNCPISDASSSLFLLYGSGEDPKQLGQLQANIQPEFVIQEF
ncbi:MAG: hypothetical protein AABZ55_08920, partial [Bdellovibrionota bacterium]